jgi:predicted nucleotidyltransferase
MTHTSLDLSGKLTSFEDLFRALASAASNEGIDFFVVGAIARDILTILAYDVRVKRATEDVDFGIRVKTWEDDTRLREGLIRTSAFRRDKKQRQRLIYQEDIQVDLVPFGAIEDEEGKILWPPEMDFEMNTLGFDEAYADGITVRVAADVELTVASLAGLTLMKLFAWKDRRHRYKKDAQDLGFIMAVYLDAGNQERVYGEGGDAIDLLDNDEFDYDLAGARLLGRDVGRILTKRSRALLEEILEAQTDENGECHLIEDMMARGENFHGEFDMALNMLKVLRQGVLESSRV